MCFHPSSAKRNFIDYPLSSCFFYVHCFQVNLFSVFNSLFCFGVFYLFLCLVGGRGCLYVFVCLLCRCSLIHNFLVAVVDTLNTKAHSSKEMPEFSFENADAKSICYCKQRIKSKLSLSSECVETKLCKQCTSFTSHLHSSCGMAWYRTLRVNIVYYA